MHLTVCLPQSILPWCTFMTPGHDNKETTSHQIRFYCMIWWGWLPTCHFSQFPKRKKTCKFFFRAFGAGPFSPVADTFNGVFFESAFLAQVFSAESAHWMRRFSAREYAYWSGDSAPRDPSGARSEWPAGSEVFFFLFSKGHGGKVTLWSERVSAKRIQPLGKTIFQFLG